MMCSLITKTLSICFPKKIYIYDVDVGQSIWQAWCGDVLSPKKAYIVADALSSNSSGSSAHLIVKELSYLE